MPDTNPFEFFVLRPLTWDTLYTQGQSASDQIRAELLALEPLVQTEFTSVLGSRIDAALTSPDITLEQTSAAIAPDAEALIADIVAKAEVPASYVPQLTAWARALLPEMMNALYEAREQK